MGSNRGTRPHVRVPAEIDTVLKRVFDVKPPAFQPHAWPERYAADFVRHNAYAFHDTSLSAVTLSTPRHRVLALIEQAYSEPEARQEALVALANAYLKQYGITPRGVPQPRQG
jgi:hypothetical protein